MDAGEVQQIIREGVPAAGDQGLVVERAGAGRALARFPFHPSMVRPGGTVSGPTLMGLADAAMYAAILGRLGRVEMAVTQNLNINFLRRPEPVDLIADARIIRLGGRSAVLEVYLYSEGGEEPVAHVTGIYALPGGDSEAKGAASGE